MNQPRRDTLIQIERLTESHRFDDELAALLTRFQYRADGITLTAAEPRPLPSAAYTAPTAGVEAVFGSLVFVCYDAQGHRMVNPVETKLVQAIVAAINTPTQQPRRPDGGTAEPLGGGPAATADEQQDTRAGEVMPQPLRALASSPHTTPSAGPSTPRCHRLSAPTPSRNTRVASAT